MMIFEVYETDRVRIEGSTNFDELTPEEQYEKKRIFAKHMVDSFFKQEVRENQKGAPHEKTHTR
jgi:hypothetical protein